jgi:hypothetical protein
MQQRFLFLGFFSQRISGSKVQKVFLFLHTKQLRVLSTQSFLYLPRSTQLTHPLTPLSRGERKPVAANDSSF